jgi:hypothetical protein
MIYGITPQGFVRKPYAVILTEMQDEARNLFGETIDVSSASPVGMFIELMSWSIDRQWAVAEETYYSMWLSTAEGASLDRVVSLGFLNRQPERFALVPLMFLGAPGTKIYAGMLAATSQDIMFETIADGEIADDGTVQITAKCIDPGIVGNVPAESITTIKTPVTGVYSVTNNAPSSGGRGIETDAELRERYSGLPAATGSSAEAIRAALMNVAHTQTVRVFENDGNAPDENGLPEKSIEAVILGGDDTEIAMVLLDKKPAGIQLFGSESVNILDSQGQMKTMRFSRPDNIDVYCIYVVEINDQWSNDYIDFIKRNAVRYIGGVDDLLVDHEGVGISNTVYAWKLLAAQQGIVGANGITVMLGRDPDPSESENLTFNNRELPRTDLDKIEVITV